MKARPAFGVKITVGSFDSTNSEQRFCSSRKRSGAVDDRLAWNVESPIGGGMRSMSTERAGLLSLYRHTRRLLPLISITVSLSLTTFVEVKFRFTLKYSFLESQLILKYSS